MKKNLLTELIHAPNIEARPANGDATRISPSDWRAAREPMTTRLNDVNGGTEDVIYQASRSMDMAVLQGILSAANYVPPTKLAYGQSVGTNASALPAAENVFVAENPDRLSYAQYTGPTNESAEQQIADTYYTAQPQYDVPPVVEARYEEPTGPIYQDIGQEGVQPYNPHEQYVDQALSIADIDITEARQPRIDAAMQLVNQANQPPTQPEFRNRTEYELAG